MTLAWVPRQSVAANYANFSTPPRSTGATDERCLALSACLRTVSGPRLPRPGLVWLGLSSAFVGGQCDTRRREKQQFTCHRLT